MKKKLLAGIILAAMGCSMLSGCTLNLNPGGNSQNEADEEDKDSEDEEESDKSDKEEDGKENGADAENTDEAVGLYSKIQICEGSQYVSEYSSVVDEEVYYGEYPVYMLDDSDKAEYPKLQRALDKITQTYSGSLCSSYSWGMEYINDMLANDYYLGTFFDVRQGMIRRADEKAVSILDYYEGYSGGAQITFFYTSHNIDPVTGEDIHILDVVTDVQGLTDAVYNSLITNYSDLDIAEETVATFFTADFINDIPWTLDYTGITVYFNPYNLSYGADNAQIASISVKDYPELFDTSYFDLSDFDYSVEMINSLPLYVDLGSDGEQDKVELFGYIESGDYLDYLMDAEYRFYDAATDLEISINGRTQHYDIFTYESDYYFVHEKGRDYICVYTAAEESSYARIYELKKSGSAEAGIESYVYPDYFDYATEDDYMYVTYKMTDPNSVRVGMTTYLFGRFVGSWTMGISENGELVPVDEYMYNTLDYSDMEDYAYIPYEFTATASVDIDVINEDGTYTGEVVTVNPGDKIRVYRTDTTEIMDFVLPDGQLGRVIVDDSGCFGDGKYPYDCFDNLYVY